MRKQAYDTPTQPGPHENGCHTANGCELCLYAQTTRNLHEVRERLFAELLAQKRRWKGRNEFNVLLRLDKPGRELCRKTAAGYDREILRGKSSLDLSETAGFKGGITGVREDFVAWLAREFESYCIDMDSQSGETMKASTKRKIPDLSNNGPYATGDDKQVAKDCGITVRQLRADRAKDDIPEDKS